MFINVKTTTIFTHCFQCYNSTIKYEFSVLNNNDLLTRGTICFTDKCMCFICFTDECMCFRCKMAIIIAYIFQLSIRQRWTIESQGRESSLVVTQPCTDHHLLCVRCVNTCVLSQGFDTAAHLVS